MIEDGADGRGMRYLEWTFDRHKTFSKSKNTPYHGWSFKGGVAAGTSVAAHLALYPIPASDLLANPKLDQNPGY